MLILSAVFNLFIIILLLTCRIIQWVKERQCDHKNGLPRHDAIPEVDETGYSEKNERTTLNKKDYNGGKTPRESERTIHITSPTMHQSAEGANPANQSGQASHNSFHLENVRNIKPTALEVSRKASESSSHADRRDGVQTEKSVENMSAKTDSNHKTASELPAR